MTCMRAVVCVEIAETSAFYPEPADVTEEEREIRESEKRKKGEARLTAKEKRTRRRAMTETESGQMGPEGAVEAGDAEDYMVVTDKQAEKRAERIHAEMSDFIIGDVDVNYARSETVPTLLVDRFADSEYVPDPEQEAEEEEEERQASLEGEREEVEEEEENSVFINDEYLSYYHRSFFADSERTELTPHAKQLIETPTFLRYDLDSHMSLVSRFGEEFADKVEVAVLEKQSEAYYKQFDAVVAEELERMEVPVALQEPTRGI